jgi:glutathione S-transferase
MATGLGRHPVDEILNVVYGDLQALNNQLGQKPYLMGDKPTKVNIFEFLL